MYARSAAEDDERFDLFISHASEDKKDVVLPLAKELERRGLKVWLDDRQLTLGDSLNTRIEHGLVRSRFGVVVISPSFAPKHWPQRELAGLTAREASADVKVILPVWHQVDQHYVAKWFPILADRLSANTDEGLDAVAAQIARALTQADKDGSSAGESARPLPKSTAGVRDRIRRFWALGLVAVSIAALAFVLTPGSSHRAAGSALLPNSVSTQVLEVSLPSGWRRSPVGLTIPGLDLTGPLTLTSAATRASLVIGSAMSSSPTLLPTELLSGLSVTPRPQSVRLGGTSFYRYSELKFRRRGLTETIYAVPTTVGVLLAACLPGAGLPRERDCERILGSMTLLAGEALQPGPQPRYASSLSRVISQLNAARTQLDWDLAHAKTAGSQAGIAKDLASAYRGAAAKLRTTSPGPAEGAANASIITALVGTSTGYSDMAKAARADNPSQFDRARSTAASWTSRTARALGRLSSFGYRLGR